MSRRWFGSREERRELSRRHPLRASLAFAAGFSVLFFAISAVETRSLRSAVLMPLTAVLSFLGMYWALSRESRN